MKIAKKARYLHTVHKACDDIFQWKFPWNCQKKARYLQAMNEESDLIFNDLSIVLSKKSSLPTYRPQSMRWHFSMKISMKLPKKKLNACRPWTKSLISFSNESFHNIIKKSSLPAYRPQSMRWHFSMKICTKHAMSCMEMSMKLPKKKLDTYVPWMKSVISFFN